MFRKFFLFILLLSFAVKLFAYEPTIIKGNVKFAANHQLRIYKYDDYITYRKVLFSTTKIDEKGNFRLEFDLTKPTYLSFSINYCEGDFYAEPQYTYNVEIKIDKKYKNPTEISASEIPMYVVSTDSNSNDIHSLITSLNIALEYYLNTNNNFEKIYYRNNKGTIDTLKSLIMDDWGETNGQYFRTYQKYTYAKADVFIRSKMSDTLFNLYINNKEIYYENTAYMEFFNSFFNDYYSSVSSKFSKFAFQDEINSPFPDLMKINNILGKDPKLVNEVIRELVLLKMLYQIYGNENYKQENIYKLLSQIENKSKFIENKKIAKNIKKIIADRSISKDLLEFEFVNISGKKNTISNYLGKYVYIQFFSTDCSKCVRDMFAIKKLIQTYGDSINFISISVDANSDNLFKFINRNNDFNWQILHFNNDFDFIEEYQVKTLPYSILLDKDGSTIANPAKLPDEDLNLQLEYLLKAGKIHKRFYIPELDDNRIKK